MGYHKQQSQYGGMARLNNLTAIIQDIDAQGKRFGRKYRNIANNDRAKEKFRKFAVEKFPNAFMIIYYNNLRAETDRIKLSK